MADYTNAQKLAAIVADWARPAIGQVASSKMSSFGWVKSINGTLMSLGLVGNNYNIVTDIQPMLDPLVASLVEPMLAEQFAKIPDAAIPQLARNILAEIRNKGSMSLLDGLVVIDQSDVNELQNLVERNLPSTDVEHYNIIR